MIASFFQRLEAARVDALLISGQATILYGAATFSEDVDLWLMPAEDNLQRFIDVLRASKARYYKLTPPFVLEYLERGHGFHFVLPGEPEGDVYLDVMGRPPRVGSFDQARSNARFFDTDFGRIHTVGIRELVEIKKTQRPADYPVIGRLALAYLEDPLLSRTEESYLWAIENVFSLSELRSLVRKHVQAYNTVESKLPELLARAVAELGQRDELSPDLEDELDAWLEAQSLPLRRADRRYWRGIIDELGRLRREGRLMPEGALV